MNDDGRRATWQPRMGPQTEAEEAIASPWRTKHNQAFGPNDTTYPNGLPQPSDSYTPTPPQNPRPRRRGGPVIAAIVLVLIAGLSGLLVLWHSATPTTFYPRPNGALLSSPSALPTETSTAASSGSSTVTPATTASPAASPSTTATVTTTPIPSTTAGVDPTATPAAPPMLSLSPTTASASCVTGNYPTITVRNTGGMELTWMVNSSAAPPLIITPTSGSVDPGGSATVKIEGTIVRLSVSFSFTSNGGNGTVTYSCL